MINRMKKLTLVAPKSDIDVISHELVWLSSVEVNPLGDKLYDGSLGEGLALSDVSADISECERNLSCLFGAIEAVSKYGSGKKRILPNFFDRDEFEGLSDDIDSALQTAHEILDITKEITSLKTEINRREAEIYGFTPWVAFDVPLGFESTDKTLLYIGTLPSTSNLDAFFAELTDECEGAVCGLVSADAVSSYLYFLVHRADREKALSIASSYGFTKASFDNASGTATDEIARARSEAAGLGTKIENCHAKLKEYAKTRPELESAYDYIGMKLEKLKIKEKTVNTENVSILQGWVPERALPRLEKKLSAYDCYYELDDPADDEDVPIQLANSRFASPFEAIVAMYSYPSYKGYDPTFLMGIFYAVIFGMIMQDVGYGLLLVFGCPLMIKLMRAKGTTKKMLQSFFICGITTTLFGALFGGYFSDLPSQVASNMLGVPDGAFPELAIVLNPVENPMGYLAFSMVVGILHLVSGMLLQAYMFIRDGDPVAAIFDVGSWLVLFAGIGLLFAAPDVGKWVAIAGVLMLVLSQGRTQKNIFMKLFKGIGSLYDIINYMSDILSYSRIFALGLSGAIIGMVMNTLGTMAGGGVVGFIVLIAVFLVGHALNFALSLLSAFVHTARLQYIEFFGKFYIDGGRPFRPSSVNTKYSEIIEEAKK